MCLSINNAWMDYIMLTTVINPIYLIFMDFNPILFAVNSLLGAWNDHDGKGSSDAEMAI